MTSVVKAALVEANRSEQLQKLAQTAHQVAKSVSDRTGNLENYGELLNLFSAVLKVTLI